MELTDKYHSEGCLWQDDQGNVWTVLSFYQVPTVELMCIHAANPEERLPDNMVLSKDNSEWNRLSPLVKQTP